MFTHDLSATKSYRTLARGSGCRWARTYRAFQLGQDDQRHGFAGESAAAGSQWDRRGVDVPILSPRGNE